MGESATPPLARNSKTATLNQMSRRPEIENLDGAACVFTGQTLARVWYYWVEAVPKESGGAGETMCGRCWYSGGGQKSAHASFKRFKDDLEKKLALAGLEAPKKWDPIMSDLERNPANIEVTSVDVREMEVESEDSEIDVRVCTLHTFALSGLTRMLRALCGAGTG